jgi:hypothetical protein
MTMTRKTLIMMLAGVVLAGLLAGCKEDAPPSLWDPGHVSGPPPTVTGVDPPTNALAGVTMLTINGTNFSPALTGNLVFFDLTAVPVVQASSTQLRVKAPNLPKDSIQVKVAALGSDLFSPGFLYRLFLAADAGIGNLAASEEPFAVECDAAGNLYVSIVASNLGIGVKKITPAGVRSDYSPAFNPTTVASWRGMKFGPAGAIFAVAGRNIIFQIPPGGGASTVWLSGSGLGTLSDLDLDANGNIWAGGAATSLFRVKQDKTVKAFPFVATVRSVRVYSGYLYVGGKKDSLEKIWRFPIDAADSLGAVEEYFNLSTIYGPNSFGPYALTFDTDGNMYVGTNAPAGMLLVRPNKSYEDMYTGILEGQTVCLSWGDGVNLYQSRSGTTSKKTVVKINAQKTGAPYYGRTLP